MSSSMQSSSSGWSSVVLLLAVAIPLFLFWRPLSYLINEYRLYRRCQQYPHIVVCKESSSNSDGIVGRITQIGVWLLGILVSFIGFAMSFFVTALASKTSKTESTRADQHVTEMTSLAETKQDVPTYSDRGSRVQSSSLRSHYQPSVSNDSNRDIGGQRHATTKQTFHVQMPSEDIFESSPQNNEIAYHRKRKGPDSMASEPVFQQRPSYSSQRRNTTIRSRPSRQYSQTQRVPTTTTLATATKSVAFDSSSLSEKMRKRRLNGERIMGYDAITGGGDEGQSRKKRKLNSGRMPLQGSAVRHPRVGAWQTTRILDKREREQREERLLRSMSRKRVKPTMEVSKPAASTAISTSAPAPAAPLFNFGQTPAATSANPPAAAATTKQEAAATPAPAFQFGASGNNTTDKKTEAAAKAPAFTLGNTSAGTTSAAATANASQAPATSAPAASAPTPAAPFKFGATSSTADSNTATKSQTAGQGAPQFGSAPAAASSAAPPFSFGSTPSAPTPAAPLFGASTNTGAPATSAAPAPSFGSSTTAPAAPAPTTPAAPLFGAKPAPTPAAPSFTAAPAPSGFGAPTPAAPSFGSSTAPTTTFGAPSAPATSSVHTKTATAPSFSFGNTKENTNPGGFNSSFQTPAPSNGFLKAQPTNTATNFGGFSAGAAPPSSTGASARRMARRAQRRRR